MPSKILGAAAEYAARVYGGDFWSLEEIKPVGTSPTQVLNNDAERVFSLLINLGAVDVVVAFDNDVSLSKGILLGAGGGNMSTNVRDDLILPANSIYALSTGIATSVYVVTLQRFRTLETGEDNAN